MQYQHVLHVENTLYAAVYLQTRLVYLAEVLYPRVENRETRRIVVANDPLDVLRPNRHRLGTYFVPILALDGAQLFVILEEWTAVDRS